MPFHSFVFFLEFVTSIETLFFSFAFSPTAFVAHQIDNKELIKSMIRAMGSAPLLGSLQEVRCMSCCLAVCVQFEIGMSIIFDVRASRHFRPGFVFWLLLFLGTVLFSRWYFGSSSSTARHFDKADTLSTDVPGFLVMSEPGRFQVIQL